jgi:hypothetical protein
MKFIKIATVIACLLPITVFSQATTPAPEGAKPTVVKKYSLKKLILTGINKYQKKRQKRLAFLKLNLTLLIKTAVVSLHGMRQLIAHLKIGLSKVRLN